MQLNDFKKEKLAEWSNIFNEWAWPKDFIIKKPKDWEELSYWNNEDDTYRTKYTVSRPYIDEILKIIGQKEFLRYHHIHNLKMNNLQFEIWWFVTRHIKDFDVYNFMGWRK